MPAAFIGHGNPMNALEHNRYTRAWREFGASIPRPRAVVVVSAHWYVGSTLVTAMETPRTIHDFYGFPQQLFDVEYPAPGAPAIAEEVAEVVKPRWVGLDEDGWGFDHGAWAVLVHLFPDADIPVIQLSVNGFEGFDEHFDLGTRLAPLRHEGILILGSGNVVHNLGLVDFGAGASGFDWAMRFDPRPLPPPCAHRRTGRCRSHPCQRAGGGLRGRSAVHDLLPSRLIPARPGRAGPGVVLGSGCGGAGRGGWAGVSPPVVFLRITYGW
jgi:4,5-DOPA dioxygenase extradiol